MVMENTTRKTRKNDARAKFFEANALALAELDRIRAALEDEATTADHGTINWAHAGTAAATFDALREIADRICGTGEYAPENK